VAYVDAQVGVVLAALDATGLAPHTAVVVLSDHGFKLGEHGAWAKGTLVEEDTRVPLLVALPTPLSTSPVPSVRPSRVSDALVELVDIFPTLLDLTGLAHRPQSQGSLNQLEGSSFAHLLTANHSRTGPRLAAPYHGEDEEHCRSAAAAAAVMQKDESTKALVFSQALRGTVMGYSMRTAAFQPGLGRFAAAEDLGSQRLGVAGPYRLSVWVKFPKNALRQWNGDTLEMGRIAAVAELAAGAAAANHSDFYGSGEVPTPPVLLPRSPLQPGSFLFVDWLLRHVCALSDLKKGERGFFTEKTRYHAWFGNVLSKAAAAGEVLDETFETAAVRWPVRLAAMELFDLSVDPREELNIAGELHQTGGLAVLTCLWAGGWQHQQGLLGSSPLSPR